MSARGDRIDAAAFTRTVDAAFVLLFMLLDLPGIGGWDEKARQELVARRAATARRFLESG